MAAPASRHHGRKNTKRGRALRPCHCAAEQINLARRRANAARHATAPWSARVAGRKISRDQGFSLRTIPEFSFAARPARDDAGLERFAMNSSFHSFDRTTHAKIVLVAAMAAALVLAIGKTAQFERTAPAASAPQPHRLVRPPAPSRERLPAPEMASSRVEAA